jgi:hypothetical protein
MRCELSCSALRAIPLNYCEALNMDMKLTDRIRFAAIFFKSLWQPSDTLTAQIFLSEDGVYLLNIDEPTESETGMMYR